MKTINKAAAKAQQGFTLVELLIVVAIIGILAAVGTPLYQDYTKQAKMAELDSFASKYKRDVEICFHTEGDLDSCDVAEATSNAEYIDKIKVENGVVTVTGVTGLSSLKFTPEAKSDGLIWTREEI